MDNEMPAGEATAQPTLPKGPAFLPSTRGNELGGVPADAPRQDVTRNDVALSRGAPEDRTGVFRHLVTDDGDIAGLVAYSIYKQHKLDWLNAFTTAKGRGPDDAELAAYIIGEGTPRRLATYRHLAEATLAGEGPAIGGNGGMATTSRPSFRRIGGFGDRGSLSTGLLATYALIAVLFIVGFLLAAHYTMSSR